MIINYQKAVMPRSNSSFYMKLLHLSMESHLHFVQNVHVFNYFYRWVISPLISRSNFKKQESTIETGAANGTN